jgi:hypothetical protein
VSLFELAIGGFFFWGSFRPDLRMGKRGLGGPATPFFRWWVRTAGLVVMTDAAIRLFGGPGIDIRLW